MSREPELALVFSPEEWVEDLHRHCTDHGGARVRQIVLDPQLALDEHFDVLVVSHRWPALTVGFVDAVHERGRLVLGVFDRTESAGRDHLLGLPVDRVIESDAGADSIVRLAGSMVADQAVTADPPTPIPRVPGREPPSESGSRLVVVSGPPGAGSTEIAIALAAGIDAATLVDADDVSPSVAQRLGLPIEPNLRGAVDAVEFGLGSPEHTVQLVNSCAVLVGLPNPSAWDQIRPGEVLRVLEHIGSRTSHLVVDVAGQIETVGRGPRTRYGLARALLEAADVIVAVGEGTPIGLARLLRWLADVDTLAPRVPVVVVINRAPTDAFRRAELIEELERTYPSSQRYCVPEDRRVTRAAWAGVPVERGPFVRAVQQVCTAIVASPPVAIGLA